MKKIIILGLILGFIVSGIFLENVLDNKEQKTIETTEPIFLSGKGCRASTVFLRNSSGTTKVLILK